MIRRRSILPQASFLWVVRVEKSFRAGIGFVQMGKSYAASAKHLDQGHAQGNLKLSHDHPVDFLYAHALELMLKGYLLTVLSDEEVRAFGHDLLGLYDAVKKEPALCDLLKQVERGVRQRWKEHLRSARDDYAARLGLGVLTAKEAEEFEIFDNQKIGAELPHLRKQVIWLSDRHSRAGSEFRYLREGLNRRAQVQMFGLSYDVVRVSLAWACEIFGQLFDQRAAEELRQQ